MADFVVARVSTARAGGKPRTLLSPLLLLHIVVCCFILLVLITLFQFPNYLILFEFVEFYCD